MTTSTQALPSALLVIGDASSVKTSTSDGGQIRRVDVTPLLELPNVVSFDEMVAEFEGMPGMADALREARVELGREAYESNGRSLAALRLAAGLSQTQLARRVGTSQPHVARIENGKTDPGTDIVSRIAGALGVDPEKVFAAVRMAREDVLNEG